MLAQVESMILFEPCKKSRGISEIHVSETKFNDVFKIQFEL